jgi:hypothetical protein
MNAEIARKLRVRDASGLRALHVPTELAEALPAGSGRGSTVVSFVGSRAELAARWREAVDALSEGGALWLAYPKKSAGKGADIDRDHGWDPLTEAGWVGVSQIALDATWSALRFKHDPALQSARAARGVERAGSAAPVKSTAKASSKKAPAKKAPAKKAPGKEKGPAKKAPGKEQGPAKKAPGKERGPAKKVLPKMQGAAKRAARMASP